MEFPERTFLSSFPFDLNQSLLQLSFPLTPPPFLHTRLWCRDFFEIKSLLISRHIMSFYCILYQPLWTKMAATNKSHNQNRRFILCFVYFFMLFNTSFSIAAMQLLVWNNCLNQYQHFSEKHIYGFSIGFLMVFFTDHKWCKSVTVLFWF